MLRYRLNGITPCHVFRWNFVTLAAEKIEILICLSGNSYLDIAVRMKDMWGNVGICGKNDGNFSEKPPPQP